MKFFYLIWSNLKRKKLRAGLTLLAILVAFFLFGILASIRQALSGGISLEGATRLVVRQKVSIINPLPESYKARMERIPGVELVVHQTWFGGVYQDSKQFFMQTPVVPDAFLDMHPEFILSPEQKKAWLENRTGAIVGRKTAERFGWKVGKRVPIQTPIWAQTSGSHTWEFEIVGIFSGRDNTTDTTPLFFRYDYFDEGRARGKGEVGWYTIRVKDPSQASSIAAQIDREFENSAYETKTEPEGAFVQAWAKQVGDIALITAVILGAVFFTILLVTGNTMAQAIRERTGELGVLKAIGFTNGQVLRLVLAESCLLAVLGGVLGIAAALLLTSGGDPTHGMLPMFFFPRREIFVGLGYAVILGLATGLLPALTAMRLRVADALRRI